MGYLLILIHLSDSYFKRLSIKRDLAKATQKKNDLKIKLANKDL
jgi:hypothetical protein